MNRTKIHAEYNNEPPFSLGKEDGKSLLEELLGDSIDKPAYTVDFCSLPDGVREIAQKAWDEVCPTVREEVARIQQTPAFQAEQDFLLYGKSAVAMDGDKILRVIDPNSEEFPE